MLKNIAVIANGPAELIPDLKPYREQIDIWIGADRGALTLLEYGITPDYAVGDFDSLKQDEVNTVRTKAKIYKQFPVEKDKTDLEIALDTAYEFKPKKLYMFGVTGGRLDHALVNIQTLYPLIKRNIHGLVVDRDNQLEMVKPGEYQIASDDIYPNISFIPYTQVVKGLTLEGFYYPLTNQTLYWGSTLCISNKLLSKNGTFSFDEGILLVIKSRDAIDETIPN